jgi:hypothetical protein
MDSAPPTSNSKSHVMRSMMLDIHPVKIYS